MIPADRVAGGEGDEELLVVGVAVQESLEPAALRRDVVEDAVEHQPEALAQLLEVLPGPQARIHLLEVDDREAAVGGVGEEGQYVDRVDRAAHEDAQEVREGFERASCPGWSAGRRR